MMPKFGFKSKKPHEGLIEDHEKDENSYKNFLAGASEIFEEKWKNPEFTQSFKEKEKGLEEFNILKSLGSGAFAKVTLVEDKKTGETFALKYMRKKKIVDMRQRDHAFNERDVLASIDSPFIVNLNMTFQDDAHLYFLLEFVAGGELFALIEAQGNLTENHAKFYASQVVLAFEYLHKLHIAYRDLKPENLLITSDGYMKLADFGFAKKVDGRTWTLCGTPEYLSPEMILSKGHNWAVDWWALGVLIYEMVAGCAPFTAQNKMGIFEKAISGQLAFRSNFSPEIRTLIKGLIQVDLTRRMGNMRGGVEEVKSHKWFDTINWAAMFNKTIKPPFVPKLKKYAADLKEKSIKTSAPDSYNDVFAGF